jgi:hypothetical protein
MRQPSFMENADGVHFMNSVQGEFTMCGDAYNFQETEGLSPEMKLKPTRKRTVTCPKCCQLIAACRGVTIKQDRYV